MKELSIGDREKRVEGEEIHTTKLGEGALDLVTAAFEPAFHARNKEQPKLESLLDGMTGKEIRDAREELDKERYRCLRIVRAIESANFLISAHLGGVDDPIYRGDDE